MADHGLWRFSDRIFDAIVVEAKPNRYLARVPALGNILCRLCVYELACWRLYAAESPMPRPAVGDRIPVKLELRWYSDTFHLEGSQAKAQAQELNNRLKAHGDVVVEGRICEKMQYCFGVQIRSEPFRGMRGVVHRENMPGRFPLDQRVFASLAQVGQRVRCRVKSVAQFVPSTWDIILSMQNVPPSQTVAAGVVPTNLDRVVAVGKTWDLDHGKLYDAVVEKRISDRCLQLEFKPEQYSMVCLLDENGVIGKTEEKRLQRLNRLEPGQTLKVAVRLQEHGGGVRLRAVEKKASVIADVETVLSTGEMVLLKAQVTEKYKNSLWVTIADGRYAGERGIVRVGRSQQARIDRAILEACRPGDHLVVRCVSLNWSEKTRLPLVLQLQAASVTSAKS